MFVRPCTNTLAEPRGEIAVMKDDGLYWMLPTTRHVNEFSY